MIARIIVVLLVVGSLLGIGFGLKNCANNKMDRDVLMQIKNRHPDWQTIDSIREIPISTGFMVDGKLIVYTISFKTKHDYVTWYYLSNDEKWMKLDHVSGKLSEP